MASNSIDSTSMIGDLKSIDKLIASLQAGRERLASGQSGARESLLGTARELVSDLETPLEAILWMIWAEPTRMFAARIALDLNLFRLLITENGRPKTVEELAAPHNASPVLVNRIARKLATMKMIEETAFGTYAPTPMTHVLAIEKYSAGFHFCYDSAGPPFVRMSEYFRKNGYIDPNNALDGPFQYAHGLKPGETPFTIFAADAALLRAFHAYVHGQREDRPSWTDPGFYPVQERLVTGLKSFPDSASAIIDVGGGAGHVLEDFRLAVPNFTGRLIVQELQSVIDHALASNPNPRIEFQVHDFFKEQPLKGARAYHMRYILHDWPDEMARGILERLRDAMEVGYSRLLINECVVEDRGAAWQHASLDLFMMALTSSRERTEGEWRALVASVEGLRVQGIWSKGIGNESIIEVVRE